MSLIKHFPSTKPTSATKSLDSFSLISGFWHNEAMGNLDKIVEKFEESIRPTIKCRIVMFEKKQYSEDSSNIWDFIKWLNRLFCVSLFDRVCIKSFKKFDETTKNVMFSYRFIFHLHELPVKFYIPYTITRIDDIYAFEMFPICFSGIKKGDEFNYISSSDIKSSDEFYHALLVECLRFLYKKCKYD